MKLHVASEIWKTASSRTLALWWPVLGIYLIVLALGAVLLWPLFGAFLQFAVNFSGQPAVTDMEIARFLLSPIGLVGLIVIAAIGLAFATMATSATMITDLADRTGHNRGLVRTFMILPGRLVRILIFSGLLAARILALSLPFLAASAVVAWLMLTEFDINYYLTNQPKEFWQAAILISLIMGAGAIILVRKLLDWSLALPEVLLDDVPPMRAFARSTDLIKGNRLTVLFVFAACTLTLLVPSVIFSVVLRWIAVALTPSAGTDLSLLIVVIGSFTLIWFLGNVLISSFSTGVFSISLLELKRQFDPDPKGVDFDNVQNDPGLEAKGQRRLKFMVLGLIAVVIGAGIIGANLMNKVRLNDTVEVIAHRGAAGARPENTMASMEKAIGDASDWLEIDVQETADGQIAVFHDADFMKIAGDPIKTWEITEADIARLDIGSWFDPEYSDEQTPLLEDVLNAAKGKANVLVELKYYGHDVRLEEQVAQIIERAGMQDNIQIMSLDLDGVNKMKALRPDWKVGLLAATALGDLTSLDVDFLAVNVGMAKPGFIRRSHDAGKPVYVWTANDPLLMSNLISAGVDGVITDEPALMRKVLAARAEMSVAERLLLSVASFFGIVATEKGYRDASP